MHSVRVKIMERVLIRITAAIHANVLPILLALIVQLQNVLQVVVSIMGHALKFQAT